MTDTELRAEIKRGVSGTYFLCGEERFLISRAAADVRRSALGGAGEYNRVILTEENYSAELLRASAEAMPMLGGSKLVELAWPRIDAWRENEINRFFDILENMKDYPDTVLLIYATEEECSAGSIPKKPSALYKKLDKTAKCVYYPRANQAKLKKWIIRHFAESGLTASDDFADALLTYSGRDMTALSGEIEKLTAYCHSHGGSVKLEYIKEVASPGGDEDAFALSNAIVAGDRASALEAVGRCRARREEPIAVLAMVSKTISDMLAIAVLLADGASPKEISERLKMHEYRVGLYAKAVAGRDVRKIRAILRRCRDADTAMKSYMSGYTALERVICTI